jgi:hypothetical protein
MYIPVGCEEKRVWMRVEGEVSGRRDLGERDGE